MINFKTFAQLHRDVAEFAARYPRHVDVVAGLPRSGQLVATLMSLHLNVPCATIQGLVRGEAWGSGMRLKRSLPLHPRVLLVDDSILSGKAMREALATGPFVWPITEIGVLYASEGIAKSWKGQANRHLLEVVPGPRTWAWNFAHAGMTRELLFDLDGIFCQDPAVPEDNEAGYVKAIREARPLLIPTWPIGGIVTHRLERRRVITKTWLDGHGIVLTPGAGLTMYPAATCRQRRREGKQDGTWKGEVFKVSEKLMFVESDPGQAARIHNISGKPVYCPAVDRFWK